MIRFLFVCAFLFYAIQFFSTPDPVPIQQRGDSFKDVFEDQRDAGFVVEYDGLVKKKPDQSRNSKVNVGDKRYRVYKSYNSQNTLLYFYFDKESKLNEISQYRFR